MTGSRAIKGMLLALLLLAFTLLAASCGAGSKENGKGTVGDRDSEIEISGREDMGAFLEELDGIINSVDPDDFGMDQLDDSQLGI